MLIILVTTSAFIAVQNTCVNEYIPFDIKPLYYKPVTAITLSRMEFRMVKSDIRLSKASSLPKSKFVINSDYWSNGSEDLRLISTLN